MSPADLDRLSPGQRPPGRPAGFQRWQDLTFLHWTVPVELVAPLLPPELSVDAWEGEAWIGLVPFSMEAVRPWWFPAVPGVSSFCETNVRTYVHLRGRDPGVWFFSLEASKSIAVLAARWGWHLPYFRSRMAVQSEGSRRIYTSERLWPAPRPAGCRVEVEFGDLLPATEPGSLPGHAQLGTLEHFLVERYILYARRGDGTLFSGRVHHVPYPVRTARVTSCDQTLLKAAGFGVSGAPRHVAASDGVDVEVFPLQRVT